MSSSTVPSSSSPLTSLPNNHHSTSTSFSSSPSSSCFSSSSSSSPPSLPPPSLSKLNRISGVLQQLDLDEKLLDLVQSKGFRDRYFVDDVEATLGDLEQAIGDAKIEMQVVERSALKRAILKEFQTSIP